MPARVTKLHSKPEIPRQLHEELAQRVLAVFWRQRRRWLNVGDLAGKLAGKPKAGCSRVGPATNRCFGWRSVKCRIHFDGREMDCIKFEPVRRWQIKRIKDPAPVVKAPCG